MVKNLDAHVDYDDFYDEFIREYNPKTGIGFCPFHDDQRHPNFHVNSNTGQWFCHVCDLGGNIYTFWTQIKRHTDESQARQTLYAHLGITDITGYKAPIPIGDVEKNHKRLLKMKEKMEFLMEKCGWSEATIVERKIGWHRGRYTIPVFDRIGNCINVRKYDPGNRDYKMLNTKGYGKPPRLYPVEKLGCDTLVFTEGEKDAIITNQMGIDAITLTSGAMTWLPKLNDLFKDKTVYICHDADSAGTRGARIKAENLHGIAKEVRIVELPLKEKGADLTDYFVHNGYTSKDFMALVKAAPIFQRKQDVTEDEPAVVVALAQASEKDLYYKNIQLKAMVAGKDLSPYLIPRDIKIECNMNYSDKACAICPVGKDAGELEYTFDLRDGNLLKMIDVSDATMNGAIKQAVGIPKGCGYWTSTVKEAMNIEEVKLIPDIDFSSEDNEYVLRTAYYTGHGIKTNRVYDLKGKTLPDPRTQYATHLIDEAKPSQDALESFEMTPELFEKLKIFQPNNSQV